MQMHNLLALNWQQKISRLLKVIATCPWLSATQRLVNHWFC